MPKPIRVNACSVWDRLQLDEAVTLLRDEAENSARDTSGGFYNLTRIKLRYVDRFIETGMGMSGTTLGAVSGHAPPARPSRLDRVHASLSGSVGRRSARTFNDEAHPRYTKAVEQKRLAVAAIEQQVRAENKLFQP